MYRIEKRFTVPIGHRLSKNKERCFSIHGHNFIILVGIKAKKLNENDMVLDFSLLKEIVNDYLDDLDHCLILNKTDEKLALQLEKLEMRVMILDHDPTAEKLSENIFDWVKNKLKMFPHIKMDYVTVYENENSKATYSKD